MRAAEPARVARTQRFEAGAALRFTALCFTASLTISCQGRDTASVERGSPASSVTPQQKPAPKPGPAVEVDPAAAKSLLAKLECARCHEGLELEAPPQAQHCVRCHRDILEGRFEAPAAQLARWKRRITSLPAVPSLANIGAHLRRDWVERYLLRPTDVRPGLRAMMPRLAITEAEARLLAGYLVPSEEPEVTFDADDVAAGRALYLEKGCAQCHDFTAAGLPLVEPEKASKGQPSLAILLAPDLSHARERVQSGVLARWLEDPQRARPRSLMPNVGLDPVQARQLAAFVMRTPLATPAPASTALPERLPVLERRVTWDEVSTEVFRDTCWHCHADPDYARGDGGPGNTGGFGFAPRRLNLASYEGASSGSFDDRGERRSLFLRGDDGIPRLVRHLLARHLEVAGGEVPGVRGMPLGLPPRTLEQIQLVESWIAQGRPR